MESIYCSGGVGRKHVMRRVSHSMQELLKMRPGNQPTRSHHLGEMFVESLLPTTERPTRSNSIVYDTEDTGTSAMSNLEAGFFPGEQSPNPDVDCPGVSRPMPSNSSILTPFLPMSPYTDGGSSAGSPTPRICSRPSKRRLTLQNLSDRIVDRSASFGQSLGHWHIHSVASKGDQVLHDVSKLFVGDWYHAFLDAKISIQLSIFALAFIFCFTLFASLLLAIDKPCGLNLGRNFTKAYLLALESMMTIGYGIPDPYMKGCWEGAVLLTIIQLVQLLLTAFVIGVIFQGLSRPQARACTVLFSEKAAIRSVNGAQYLMFRVCDLRFRHSLIEAHVRLYCVQRHPVYGFSALPMRIDQPDDDLGGMILLTLPTIVVHRIDAWSPLSPKFASAMPSKKCNTSPDESSGTADEGSSCTNHNNYAKPFDRKLYRQPSWPSAGQRQVDAESGNRDACMCPFCGDSFNTIAMLVRHCEYNSRMDEASGLEQQYRHQKLPLSDLQRISHADPRREELAAHWNSNYLEVVVLVEGIEPTTSSTLQVRHSYVIGRGQSPVEDDVAWDADFADCCRVPGNGKKGLGVDLSLFHEVVACPPM